MISLKKSLILGTITIALLSGCASGVGTTALKNETHQTLSAKIQKNASTKSDIVAMFGEPARVVQGKKGAHTYVYEYAESKGGNISLDKMLSAVDSATAIADSAQGAANSARGVGTGVKAAGKGYGTRGVSNSTRSVGNNVQNIQDHAENIQNLGAGGEVTLYKVLTVTFNSKGIVTRYALR